MDNAVELPGGGALSGA